MVARTQYIVIKTEKKELIKSENNFSSQKYDKCIFHLLFRARNKLIFASVLCLVFMTGEVVGGVLSNSLAIATDAAHLLTGRITFYRLDSDRLFSLTRFGIIHDLSVCHMDGSKTKEPKNVIWMAQSRGAGGDNICAHDLGGHRDFVLYGCSPGYQSGIHHLIYRLQLKDFF